MTPLPAIDTNGVAGFWLRAIASGAVLADTPLPAAVECFGDSAELADELLDLVLHGPKRATAGAVAEFELEGAPLPEIGDMWIACDGRGRPRAVLRTTDVRVGPLTSVDDAFAWDEGEGDRTRATWLADHETFFRQALPALGLTFTPDLLTVFERFEVPYSE
jgi:uncharacterized protein YhfF